MDPAESFNTRRWRRDVLIAVGVLTLVFAIGAAAMSIAETYESGSIVALGVLTVATTLWIAACLRGGTGGLVGMCFLVLLLVSIGLGYTVLGITGSEGGLIGAVILLTFAVAVVPVTAFWSIIDLFRPPQQRRWQSKRYSVTGGAQ